MTQFVRLEDGDMHVVEDGPTDASALLLIHGSAGAQSRQRSPSSDHGQWRAWL